MNLRNHLMAIRAVRKAIVKPMNRVNHSWLVKLKPDLRRSKPVAAAMVGIARRKENSTACERLRLTKRPPKMVAAALETPGMMDNDWARPMRR